MNVLRMVALAELKKNRARTFAASAGAALSSLMLTVTVCVFTSLQHYYALNGVTDSKFYAVVGGISLAFLALFATVSIVLIRTSFVISVSERTRELGILASVGATQKQIKRSVLTESLYISAFGIPAGIGLGIGLLALALHIIRPMVREGLPGHGDLTLYISVPYLIGIALLGLGTILLSANAPARRAAKQPAIEAIRMTADVKIRARDLKVSRLTQKLFGFPGALAMKNIRRNRRRYRGTLTALFMSFVLFVMAGAAGWSAERRLTYDLNLDPRDISVTLPHDYAGRDALFAKLSAVGGVTEAVAVLSTGTVNLTYAAKDMNPDYMERENLRPDDMTFLHAEVYIYNDAYFRRYTEREGFDFAPVLLYTVDSEMAYPGYTVFLPGTEVGLRTYSDPGLTFTANQITATPLFGLIPAGGMRAEVYLPLSLVDEYPIFKTQSDYRTYEFSFMASDPERAYTEMQQIAAAEGSLGISVTDQYNAEVPRQNLVAILLAILYSFAGFLTLLAVANVFISVSADVALRRRELTALRAVGLDDRSMNGMMLFECAFYGIKTLIYGLPVTFALNYALFWLIEKGLAGRFSLPWWSYLAGIAGIFAVMALTAAYAIRKFRKMNTMEDMYT